MLQPCTASAQAMSGSSTKSRTVQALMPMHAPWTSLSCRHSWTY